MLSDMEFSLCRCRVFQRCSLRLFCYARLLSFFDRQESFFFSGFAVPMALFIIGRAVLIALFLYSCEILLHSY